MIVMPQIELQTIVVGHERRVPRAEMGAFERGSPWG